MKVDDIQLHDGCLREMRVDYGARRAEILVDIYLEAGASSRVPALLSFEGVLSISQFTDLERLATHATPGNLNYWVPVQDGTTFIYLSDGCLAIRATRVQAQVA